MTQAKEKARELIDKFMPLCDGGICEEVINDYNRVYGNGINIEKKFRDLAKHAHLYHAKKCALIAVDEIIGYSKMHGFIGLTEYWHEVKNEIEKL
jgi:hypothetical protein